MPSGSSGADPPADLGVKAGFVVNFIRLVNWLSIPGEQNSAVLPVCACSRSEFAAAVENAVSGKMVGSRSIVFRIEAPPDLRKCRVVLFDRQQFPFSRSAVRTLRGAPILTIGNGPEFADTGSMFQLVVESGKVRFDVCLDVIRHSGLEVNSGLLQLSRNLRTDCDAAN